MNFFIKFYNKFKNPLSFPLLISGIIILLLSITRGFDLPILKHISIAPEYRSSSLIIGCVMIATAVGLEISSGYKRRRR
ncbi:MAG: hypothetical protein H7A24_01780 [Leptospiraceae bacterium]|nr:hypothetical protein [Leptospiraceae bacterium]MCP5510580.1 hypothetical protein [Leptospiraceae bacterium]